MENSQQRLKNLFTDRFEVDSNVDKENNEQVEVYINIGDKTANCGIVETFSVPYSLEKTEQYNRRMEWACKNILTRLRTDGITPNNIDTFILSDNGKNFVRASL